MTSLWLSGHRPQESKGTVVRLPVNEGVDKTNPDQWAATLTAQEGKSITVSVRPSADAVVGKYDRLKIHATNVEFDPRRC